MRCSRWPGCPDCGILRALRASARWSLAATVSLAHVCSTFSLARLFFLFFQYFVHFVLGWRAQQRSTATAICSITCSNNVPRQQVTFSAVCVVWSRMFVYFTGIVSSLVDQCMLKAQHGSMAEVVGLPPKWSARWKKRRMHCRACTHRAASVVRRFTTVRRGCAWPTACPWASR